jgi:hypothetical protein
MADVTNNQRSPRFGSTIALEKIAFSSVCDGYAAENKLSLEQAQIVLYQRAFGADEARRGSLAACLSHLIAQASGHRGPPTDILRGRQVGSLRGHARFSLPAEEATAPGQSASRT